jgi:hypothetical protein
MVRFKPNRLKAFSVVLCVAALCGLSTGSVFAQNGTFDDLLEKLKDKGVLTEDEYQALRKAREEELLEQRVHQARLQAKRVSM